MVRHQTICIENATRRQWLSRYLVSWTNLLIQHRNEMSVVLFIIENILPVYTSKHHMIDACSARFSWTSCHILSLIWHKGKKDIANHQIILQKSHKGTDPLCDDNHCTKRKPRKEKSKRGFLLYYRTGGLSPCVTIRRKSKGREPHTVPVPL